MADAVLPPVRAAFRAVTATVVPSAEALDEDGWERAEALVEAALRDRPPAVRRQIVLFLRAVEWMPLARWGRTFSGLSPERRHRVLSALQDSPLLLLRRGVWGLRTLAFLGYYGQPAVRRAVGYRAHPRGWLARRTDGVDPGDAPPVAPGPDSPPPSPGP